MALRESGTVSRVKILEHFFKGEVEMLLLHIYTVKALLAFLPRLVIFPLQQDSKGLEIEDTEGSYTSPFSFLKVLLFLVRADLKWAYYQASPQQPGHTWEPCI